MRISILLGGALVAAIGLAACSANGASSASRAKKGRPFGKFTAVFDPNPGDPVTDTVTELRHVKPSYGKYKWLQTVKVCDGGCATGYVGIATE